MHDRIALSLGLCVVVFCLAGCDYARSTAPLSEDARIAGGAAPYLATIPKGSLSRVIKGRAGPLTLAQARGRLGTYASHPDRWDAFEAVQGAASHESGAAALTAHSTMASTVMVDTLFGGPFTQIGGTIADVSVSSHATQHNGLATVEAWAFPSTAVGSQIPQDQPALHCPEGGTNGTGYYCGTGAAYDVDCEAFGGSRIEANSTHNGAWTNGAFTSGEVDRVSQCLPSGGGSGGGDGGDSGECTTYIVERSDDGGLTWYEVGRFTSCD